jgi:hypothetical protein
MSFPRHTKIYQSDEPERSRTNCSASLGDHRSDESSAGYSFAGCSPAEPASASPAATSFSHNPAAVHCSAARRNLSPFSLSQPKGPLQKVYLLVTVAVAKITFRLQSALRALASPAVICRGAVVTGDRSLSFVQLRMVLQLLYNVCGPIEVTVLLGGMGFSAPGQIDEISEQFDADLQRLDTFRGIHAHLVALVVEQCWLRCLVSSGCCVANHMCHLATFCASVVYRGFSPS